MRFKEFLLNEQDPILGGGPGAPPPGMGAPPGLGGPPGGPLGADPMGGGMGGAPPGADPMGGGMGGAPPGGMPGAPGGGAGVAPQVPVKMKDRDIWGVLGDILNGDKKGSGDNKGSMLQSGPQPGGKKPGGFLMQ
jgi:hypothetical protein